MECVLYDKLKNKAKKVIGNPIFENPKAKTEKQN